MAKIRSKYSKLDLFMKKLLEENNIEHEMYPSLKGHPDFLIKPRVVLFCDSSFWHGRDWKDLKNRLAKSLNSEYWIKHISSNVQRDKLITKSLEKDRFIVLRLWDTEIFKKPLDCITRIKKAQSQSKKL